MIFIAQDERRRAKRFVVVRIASRGGDLTIYVAILYFYGIASLPYAFAISSIYDYTLDFFGQKFWAFGNPFVFSWKTAKEFGIYLLVRGSIIALAALTYFGLTVGLTMKTWSALLITFLVFLPLAFVCYRKIFLGRVGGL